VGGKKKKKKSDRWGRSAELLFRTLWWSYERSTPLHPPSTSTAPPSPPLGDGPAVAKRARTGGASAPPAIDRATLATALAHGPATAAALATNLGVLGHPAATATLVSVLRGMLTEWLVVRVGVSEEVPVDAGDECTLYALL